MPLMLVKRIISASLSSQDPADSTEKARTLLQSTDRYFTRLPLRPFTSMIRSRREVNRNESRPHLKASSTLSSSMRILGSCLSCLSTRLASIWLASSPSQSRKPPTLPAPSASSTRSLAGAPPGTSAPVLPPTRIIALRCLAMAKRSTPLTKSIDVSPPPEVWSFSVQSESRTLPAVSTEKALIASYGMLWYFTALPVMPCTFLIRMRFVVKNLSSRPAPPRSLNAKMTRSLSVRRSGQSFRRPASPAAASVWIALSPT
mmetsp:Transcript_110297/g.299242  ORF Transcript_110297/g.299242 Transcript_110297/m.299242 type:complete len:259 (-) Transcript_110297:60-836(-)